MKKIITILFIFFMTFSMWCESEKVDPFKMTYEKKITKQSSAFINTKIKLAEIFSTNVIKMEDKDYGVIVCKAKTPNEVHYTFKISISDSLYTVEFYDFLFDAAGIMLIPLDTKFQYDKMKMEVTDDLAKALLNAVE